MTCYICGATLKHKSRAFYPTCFDCPRVKRGNKGYLVARDRTTNRQTMAHRVIYEHHHGVVLLPHQNIHHKNGVRDDNRIENLELWETQQPYGQRASDLRPAARDLGLLPSRPYRPISTSPWRVLLAPPRP